MAFERLALGEIRRGQIAHCEIQRYALFVCEFPMTVTGKIQKLLIREAMEKELKGAL